VRWPGNGDAHHARESSWTATARWSSSGATSRTRRSSSSCLGRQHELKAAGLPLIVISNQSGVGRGLFPLSRVYEVMARLRVEARAAGIEVDGIYFCPHRPEDGCACRKPGTLLLERAAEDHLLSLRDSFMVGDKLLDVETVQCAGGRGVLVRSGYGREEERSLGGAVASHEPDHVCDGLEGASAWILATLESAEQE
jgi:D-glycero-D-manno-heptose 1,7-bisphosphate phosphatase